MQRIIQLNGIHKSYSLGKTRVPALGPIDIEFERGEFTAIAGPSGSGKTTLLNIIGCLDKPDQGRIIFEGVDITDRSLDSLAGLRGRRLGFIFQSFNLIEVLTAFENVEYPLLMTETPSAARRERVDLWGHGARSSFFTFRDQALTQLLKFCSQTQIVLRFPLDCLHRHRDSRRAFPVSFRDLSHGH